MPDATDDRPLTMQDFLDLTWRNCRAVDADYRWTPEDMTTSLQNGATAYALSYTGTFEFMTDMKRKAQRGVLSANQAKGVMNCMMAEVRRQRAASVPLETVDMSALMTLFQRAGTHLRNPRITLGIPVNRPGNTIASGNPFTSVTLKLMTRGANPGSISIQTGGWPNGIWYGRVEPNGRLVRSRVMTEAVMELVRELAADPVAAALRYASLTGQCCFCNLPLSTPESTTAGYGPVCAQHYGLPWGTRHGTEEGVVSTPEGFTYHPDPVTPRRRTPQVPAMEGMTPMGLALEILRDSGINTEHWPGLGRTIHMCGECPAFGICQEQGQCNGGVVA